MKSNKNKTLFRKIFGLIAVLFFLLSNALAVFAQTTQVNDKIPYGSWKVSQVTIEKKTNGQMEKNIYATAAEVKEFVPCAQTWEIIDSKTVVLHYSDDIGEEITEYAFEDGQLRINMMGAILKYQYNINDKTLTLTSIRKYKWNQHDGSMDDIEEKRIITLYLQK